MKIAWKDLLINHNRPAEIDFETENIAAEEVNNLNNCEESVKLKNITYNIWKEKNGTRNKRKIESNK